VFKEKVDNNENKYQVDGQWRDLQIIREEIIVKGQAKPTIFNIRLTHRGPILGKDDHFAA
jgi:acyl-homoserine lactone acylase PvdQ